MVELEMINRGVITVVPKQVFYDWINGIAPNDPVNSTDFQEHNAYLIKDDFEYRNIDTIVKKYWEYIFENELFGMYTDEAAWPKNRTFKLFKEWFNYYVSSVVLDLEDGPVIKE